ARAFSPCMLPGHLTAAVLVERARPTHRRYGQTISARPSRVVGRFVARVQALREPRRCRIPQADLAALADLRARADRRAWLAAAAAQSAMTRRLRPVQCRLGTNFCTRQFRVSET